jgi:hypothetical protein
MFWVISLQILLDITDQVMKVSTRRGRNRILSKFEAGTATVTLNDPDSDFNPQNTSGPYYGKLLPLRKIRIYATLEYEGSTIGNSNLCWIHNILRYRILPTVLIQHLQ